MGFLKSKSNGVEIITPDENITFITSASYKQELAEIIENNFQLIMDMSELSFIDSSGVGLIIETSFKIRKKHGLFVICNVNEKIFKVFKLANLVETINIAEDIETALALFVE